MPLAKRGRTTGQLSHFFSRGTIFAEFTARHGMTPAMAAGIADRIWTVRDPIEAA